MLESKDSKLILSSRLLSRLSRPWQPEVGPAFNRPGVTTMFAGCSGRVVAFGGNLLTRAKGREGWTIFGSGWTVEAIFDLPHHPACTRG